MNEVQLLQELNAALSADRDLIHGYDVATQFKAEVERFEKLVHLNLDDAHALVDGKWLTDVFAPKESARKPEECRQEWLAHSIMTGGLDDVRSLWKRITGKVP